MIIIDTVKERKVSLDKVEMEIYRLAQAYINTNNIIDIDFSSLNESWPNQIKIEIKSNLNKISGKIIVNGQERKIEKYFQSQIK